MDSPAKRLQCGYIELAKSADLIILALVIADLLGRLYVGMANDLLTTICLASKAKIAVSCQQ
ncbi:MAG: hypothetical protein ACTS73_09780 [Arsenophonus sp. NEOnobi-MAG3]